MQVYIQYVKNILADTLRLDFILIIFSKLCAVCIFLSTYALNAFLRNLTHFKEALPCPYAGHMVKQFTISGAKTSPSYRLPAPLTWVTRP